MENINLIRKIAWSFHHSTGMDWDDLFQEASYYYVKALDSYDPSKGVKLSTYMWTAVSNYLKNYLETEQKHRLISIDDTDLRYHPAKDPIPFWESLTTEAQEIGEYVLRNSMEFVCLKPEDVDFIVYFIFMHKGWSPEKIEAGLLDLKRVCSTK